MRRLPPATIGVLLLAAACSKETPTRIPVQENRPPEILGIDLRPERVLAFHEIRATCRARDRDNQPMFFKWEASAGNFPLGFRAQAVSWRSPATGSIHTLRVTVTDTQESTTASIDVPIAFILPPDSLRFVNGANLVTLSWPQSPDAGLEGWSGYEIYAASRDLAGLPAEELAPYRLTPQPTTRLEYRVSPAEPGVRIFYRILSRRDYAGIVERSPGGPQVDTAPPLAGLNREPLYEMASRRGRKAVHLPGGEVEAIDPGNVSRFDFYLGTSSSNDGPGTPQLKSPDRLAYLDPAWGGRQTLFRELKGDWSNSKPPPAPEGYTPSVLARQGVVYAMYTADGHYAKVRILELRGAYPERRVEYQWAWQPLGGYERY